jgi:hypothetical protein
MELAALLAGILTLLSITLAVRTLMKEWRARRPAPAALHVVAVCSQAGPAAHPQRA